MSKNSREKILTAGKKEFAKYGYSKSSIRNICKAADVNIALVRYYFKDKEGLYRELIQSFFMEKQKLMIDKPITPFENNPEAKLKSFLTNVLTTMDPEGEDYWMKAIMKFEMIEHGILMDELFSKIFFNDLNFLKSIYAEITNLKSSSIIVQQLAEFTLANCIFYTMNDSFFLLLHHGKRPNKKYYIELTNTIYSVCMAGAMSLRKTN
ncbi:MAG: TetR/AcrR family transcriptional regulator [Leptospiraceae bacterium]|nr:TetR/AcrR family transcriptional regulator [Leptospiraceae bacterium]